MTTDRSLLEVRQAAPWAVLRTGSARVEDVEVLDDDGLAIDAWVHGEGDHVVRMARVAYGDVACTCGGGRAPWCAHAVAVALWELRDRGAESRESLDRFAGRARAMARLESAEDALVAQYVAMVDDDESAFSDLRVDLGDRNVDRQIAERLAWLTPHDDRRLHTFIECVITARVQDTEDVTVGLHALEAATSIIVHGSLPRAAVARSALSLYPHARSHLGGSWWGAGWRSIEDIARALSAAVCDGHLDPQEVARRILDAESAHPAVVDRIPVLARLAPSLGLEIGVALAEDFDRRDLDETGDPRRRLDVALASWDPSRLADALAQWPEAPLGEISAMLRGRPASQRLPVVEQAVAKGAVRRGGWRRPLALREVPAAAVCHPTAAVHHTLMARTESCDEAEEWHAVPVSEVVDVLASPNILREQQD